MGKKRTNRSLEERRGAVSRASKDGTALVCKKGAGQAMGNHQPLYFSLFFSSSRCFGMKQEPHSIHTTGVLTQVLHAEARWTLGVRDAELHLGVVAFLALADAVVGGIARLHLHLSLPTDDVAVAAFLQVVPVVCVVQLGAGRAHRLPVPAAVLGHEGPRRALLAGHLLVGHSIFPLVGGLGVGAKLSQEQEERGKHPLQHRGSKEPLAHPLAEAEAASAAVVLQNLLPS